MALRRMLSSSYINHYLDKMDAQVISGMPRIGYYDRCAPQEVVALNFKFMKEVITALGFETLSIERGWGFAPPIPLGFSRIASRGSSKTIFEKGRDR
jgi:hypothetical protein